MDVAPPGSPPKAGSWIRRIAFLGAAALLALAFLFAFPFLRAEWLFRRIPGEYSHRQAHYDALILKLSREKIDSNGQSYYFIETDRNPDSLRRLGEDEDRHPLRQKSCLIEVYRERDGSLVAFFITRDLGSMAGAQGLVYSAAEPRQGQFGLGGRWVSVSPNWWAVWY